MVLDEPDANLDAGGEAALVKVLRALRDQRVTTVVITHRPSLVSHVDKILVLHTGRIHQFGPASQVRQSLRPLHAATSNAA